LDNTLSNHYQVQAQVDKVKFRSIQSAQVNIAELYYLHRFESTAERLEFNDSLLADTKYLFAIAERVDGGLRSRNTTQRELKTVNQ
jgi:hypothetical protein